MAPGDIVKPLAPYIAVWGVAVIAPGDIVKPLSTH